MERELFDRINISIHLLTTNTNWYLSNYINNWEQV